MQILQSTKGLGEGTDATLAFSFPIVDVTDYGTIVDLFKVVPESVKEFE